MAKITTSFVNHYKLTLQTSLPQLSTYVEELDNELSDSKTKEQARKARDQAKKQLGLSKKQANTFIPIRASGRHVVERNPIKIIAQDIIKNNLLPEEINRIAYVLASSAPTTVAGNSQLNLLRKKLRKLGADYLITEVAKIPFVTEEANQIQARKRILRGINGYDCPKFFYLEKVQERLNECHALSVEHYGVMNDRPNTPAPKQENTSDGVRFLMYKTESVRRCPILKRKVKGKVNYLALWWS
ncbi:23256_t:CDS:2 [Gigaspora margarita]|uniref:23256_t:CDS:1 n=1 Tax=Gigaspora margarita TaxID=4874 RepID=A0ABN7W0E5_GIGMA|nr:23256_t:CDS:2 [Gigaspora margarita]